MAEHNEQGKFGEEQARAYLKKLGYEILDCNWQFKKFEIDIVAKDLEKIVVVEVKTRKNAEYGSPESFVTRKKQSQLIQAVNHYVNKKQLNNEIRFDIISVLFDGSNLVVEHIPDAFYPVVR
jgi:putative endonuclease